MSAQNLTGNTSSNSLNSPDSIPGAVSTGTSAKCSPASSTRPIQIIWPSFVVLLSLTLFLGHQSGLLAHARPETLAYFPPIAAALAVTVFAWQRYRREANGWLLGVAGTFFLFLVLAGQQAFIDALGGAKDTLGKDLPWQPWFVARLAVACGLFSALAAPPGLVVQSSKAVRQSMFTIVLVAFLGFPIWATQMPFDLHIRTASGLSVADALLLVASGLLLILVFARLRRNIASTDPLYHILYGWVLILAWSAACRVFPYGDPSIAHWVELVSLGIASVVLCGQLVWSAVALQGQYETEASYLSASRDVLSRIVSSPREQTPDVFLESCSRVTGCNKGLLLMLSDSGNQAVVAATYPVRAVPVEPGKTLSLEPERRTGFWSGPTARAIRERKTVVVEAVMSDVEFVNWREVADGAGYQVSIPVIHQGKVAGAVALWFTEDRWQPNVCMPIAQTVVESVASALSSLRDDYVRKTGEEALHAGAA